MYCICRHHPSNQHEDDLSEIGTRLEGDLEEEESKRKVGDVFLVLSQAESERPRRPATFNHSPRLSVLAYLFLPSVPPFLASFK
ncbi:unnamed protein product [Caenorhabditis auriculariae]|uniref:Uncharacterized protein n=1 Tax=Caenorhabditis auriculariae TaxID=2777116 RepID=A0A8S1HNF5_9PELO|nr:unnamed protein product [Caenorhabditis auriculariae]